MAEDERRWRARHAHESHGVSYGTVGTATYDETTGTWRFLRSDSLAGSSSGESREQHAHSVHGKVFKVVSEPEHLFASEFPVSIAPTNFLTGLEWKHNPELGPAWSTIDEYTREARLGDGHATDHSRETLAFGQARYLDLDGKIQDAEPLPVMARVSGPAHATVRITSLGRQMVELSMTARDESYCEVPSLSSNVGIKHVSSTPVLQIIFSQHSPNHLAIRTVSSTRVFQLLVGVDDVMQLGDIVCLPISCTGGHSQVDFAFSPTDHRLLAIVDAQGNFSTWTVHGRRSRSARVLYRAKLETSGKIFSFDDKQRPVNTGLYFDGWHSVFFGSGQGQNTDVLWVCNRQNAILYGLDGEERCRVDVRLDTRRQDMYILDARTGSKSNLVIVLTTVRLLLFDLAQQEWRDRGSRSSGPMLLCSWEHQHAVTAGLRLSTFQHGPKTVLMVYDGADRSILATSIDLDEHRDSVAATASAMRRIQLQWPSGLSVKQFVVVGTQAKHQTGKTHGHVLVRIIAQHEDLSISTCFAEVVKSSSSISSLLKPDQFILRFPPVRTRTQKSSRYAAEEEGAEDVTDFIVPDDPDEEDLSHAVPHHFAPPTGPLPQSRHVNLSHVAEQLVVLPDTSERSDMDDLVAHLQHAVLGPIEQASTLNQLIESSKYRLDDIHTESDMLQDVITSLSSHLSVLQHTKSLQDTYQSLFDVSITRLPASVPDRTRLHRERLVRQIALDLYLSSTVVRPRAGEHPFESLEKTDISFQFNSQATTLHNPSSSQQLPLSSSPEPTSSPPAPRFAATQPTTHLPNLVSSSPTTFYPSTQPDQRGRTDDPLSSPTQEQQNQRPQLVSALARLRTLTNLDLNTKSALSAQTQTQHTTSLLSHLPDSLTDPAHYNWRAHELAASTPAKTQPDRAKEKTKRSRRAKTAAKGRDARSGKTGQTNHFETHMPSLAIRTNDHSTRQPHPEPQAIPSSSVPTQPRPKTQISLPASSQIPVSAAPFSNHLNLRHALTSPPQSQLALHQRGSLVPDRTDTIPSMGMSMSQPQLQHSLFNTQSSTTTKNKKPKKRKAGF